MKVTNVHQRTFAATPEQLAPLVADFGRATALRLDHLGS